MTWTVPTQPDYSLKHDDSGIFVWGFQRALNFWRRRNEDLHGKPLTLLVEDGGFGGATGGATRTFQRRLGLEIDGVAGPVTQQALCWYVCPIVAPIDPLPDLLYALIMAESNGNIGEPNWDIPGGVDCGFTQRRVYGPPFADGEITRAFDLAYQSRLTRDSLVSLRGIFLPKLGTQSHQRPDEFAYRLAVLNHNYPAGADRISRTPYADLSDYWVTVRTDNVWVRNIGAHFLDGAPVETPLDWCKFYALGSPEHNTEGRAVLGVWP